MFNVGDMVQVKPSASSNYTITTEDATLEVVEMRGRDTMILKVIYHRSKPHTIGSRHGVPCSDFVYLGSVNSIVQVSSLNYIQSSELSDEDKKLIEGALSCLK